ncbi:MAG: hypothetical protein KIT84_24615 [Labilithrix sp.]|nr:hypothetical protein [Labilithrix sp.]MCW5814233.1 hypothetical protein [Labilithrix sp.]
MGAAPKVAAPKVAAPKDAKDADLLVDDGKRRPPEADPLDPDTRRFAQLAPPAFTPVAAAPVAAADEIAPRARVSMEELLPQLVKRIAWAGDRRRGSVQMELGAGPHAGTVVTVHADDGHVRIELHGDDAGTLQRRLEARGFHVER